MQQAQPIQPRRNRSHPAFESRPRLVKSLPSIRWIRELPIKYEAKKKHLPGRAGGVGVACEDRGGNPQQAATFSESDGGRHSYKQPSCQKITSMGAPAQPLAL
jgi:hypothetical protein